MIEEFIGKPVRVKAIQWNGNNLEEVKRFSNGLAHMSARRLVIETLEGTMQVLVGDWIVCGTRGEFYPVKPDVMEAKYNKMIRED